MTQYQQNLISALDRISKLLQAIDTQNESSESKKNQILGFIEGLILGIEGNKGNQ